MLEEILTKGTQCRTHTRTRTHTLDNDDKQKAKMPPRDIRVHEAIEASSQYYYIRQIHGQQWLQAETSL